MEEQSKPAQEQGSKSLDLLEIFSALSLVDLMKTIGIEFIRRQRFGVVVSLQAMPTGETDLQSAAFWPEDSPLNDMPLSRQLLELAKTASVLEEKGNNYYRTRKSLDGQGVEGGESSPDPKAN